MRTIAPKIEKFGLSEEDLRDITNTFSKFPFVHTVKIFGSRAMGNHQPFSDIDLVIMKYDGDLSEMSLVHDSLEEETNLPYFTDLIDYNSIGNENLKKHIDRYGKVIYKKK